MLQIIALMILICVYPDSGKQVNSIVCLHPLKKGAALEASVVGIAVGSFYLVGRR